MDNVSKFAPGIGLINKYNNCFVNSVIQALLYNGAFLDFLLSIQDEAASFNCTICNLRLMYNWTKEKNAFLPILILNKLENILPNAVIGQQQDCHEFFTFFLNRLKNDCENHHTHALCLLKEITEGSVCEKIICTHCQTTKAKTELLTVNDRENFFSFNPKFCYLTII